MITVAAVVARTTTAGGLKGLLHEGGWLSVIDSQLSYTAIDGLLTLS